MIAEDRQLRKIIHSSIVNPSSVRYVSTVRQYGTTVLHVVIKCMFFIFSFSKFRTCENTKNVSSATWQFSISEKPTVTINCSNPIDVKEEKDLTCQCKGEGGFPPANVTWYKGGVQIGDAGDEEKLLTLRNAKKTDSGTYNCVAQSYTLKEEKSIQVTVNPSCEYL